MTSANETVLDGRKREELLDEIERLAGSYVPEWHFDRNDPDIGSVIALLYADMMQDNVRRFNTLLERDHVELINMLGLSLRPAFPAHSHVLMNMAYHTVPGCRIPKGMKLLGGENEELNLVYETSHNVYVTQSRIRSIFQASGKSGKVIPVFGNFPPVEYLQQKAAEEEAPELLLAEEPEEEERMEDPGIQPFFLFGFEGAGYGKNGLLLYHDHLFDGEENQIRMQILGAADLAEDIEAGKYRLSCYGSQGFVPVKELKLEGSECISFYKDASWEKVMEQDKEYTVLLLEPTEPVRQNLTASDIRFSSDGVPEPAQAVYNGISELEPESFQPFGDTLALYAETMIQHPYFDRAGSMVTVSFDLSYGIRLVSVEQAQVDKSLKVIKRKPRRDVQGAPAEIYADEIALEYYNGIGWRALPVDTPVSQLFAGKTASHCELTFFCPEDWQESESGGLTGRFLRLRLLRADNCFYQPALHHYPVMTGLRVSYSYAGRMERPQKMIRFEGSRKRDVTAALWSGERIVLLSRSIYEDTALYLGFDQKLEEGPISIFFEIDGTEGYSGGRLAFSYSTRTGFSRLKLTDRTESLSHTGNVLFMPPSDMAKQTLEGQEAYWIKITDLKQELEEHPGRRPLIRNIVPNGIEVDNIDTMGEEDYYIDAFGPDMEFPINARNILSVDVWVNETANFTAGEMKHLLLQHPETTRAEYDFLGNITEFYVRWQEVDNFDCSGSIDRHFTVDRMNSRIHFGDGVHVMIPRNTSGIAFKLQARCCAGQAGNLDIGRISGVLGTLMFVDQICNPVQASGGMDMETMDEALSRGTTMLNSRKRLISAADYERMVLDFSHQIVQARVVTGRRKDKTIDPGVISIVLLTEDYRSGSSSFINLRKRLLESLFTRCEMTVDPEQLEIVEPVYTEISVEVWVKAVGDADTFEIQQRLLDALNRYLDPLQNPCWEIGRVAGENQIRLMLNMEKGSVLIQKMMITAGYRDEQGFHEKDLKSLEGNPYILTVSGTHKIHFE